MTSMAQGPVLTVEQHLEDHDFVMNYNGDSNSGLHNKETSDTRASHETMRARGDARQCIKGEHTLPSTYFL